MSSTSSARAAPSGSQPAEVRNFRVAASPSNAQATAAVEAVVPPQVDAGGEQPAAVPAPAPPRLDQQVGHRRHVAAERVGRLVRGQRLLVGRTGGGEAHQIRLLGLLDGDQHPVRARGRLLDRVAPPPGEPRLVQVVEHVPGQHPPVRDPPGRELDAGDLAGVLGTRRADVPESHGTVSLRRAREATVAQGARPDGRAGRRAWSCSPSRSPVPRPWRPSGTASSTCRSTTAR